MAASATPPTHATILDILEHSAYNPGIVPQLESYVDAQLNQIIEGNINASNDYRYSFDANRTLLKLYQFFPHLANDHIISKIFFLALFEFPSTDFTALACLVSEKIQSREPCATLMRCSNLLETSNFSEFWDLLRQLSNDDSAIDKTSSLAKAASSPTSIRKFRSSILSLLSLTYATAPLAVVLTALELKSSYALKDFLKELSDDNDTVVKEVKENDLRVEFQSTAANTRRTRVFKDGVHFDALASIIVNAGAAKE